MNLVDTHCHLHREEFDADRGEVVARAQKTGVVALLNPATDLASNDRVLELTKQFPSVYAALGVHPNHSSELTEEALARLAKGCTQPQVVAVGEIGLDFYRDFTPRQVQQEALRKLLLLAHEMNLPVILHCREAYPELFYILRQCIKPPIRWLIHCFSGTLPQAQEALDLGLYLSFAANLTFPNAKELREVARAVAFDKVLLETDAPFLAPQAHRGKRNEPSFLPELVKAWAEIRDLTPEDVARVTTVNAWHLFGIGEAPLPKIAYPIRRSLYLNVTNACTDRCVFCSLSLEEFWKAEGSSPFVKGHNLRIPRDPTVEEVVEAAGDPTGYEEVVFCGYGEPIIKLDLLLKVAKALKAKGARRIRLNTNGHGNLIHRRSVADDLKALVDEASVSLNTPNAQQYLEICRPVFGLSTYDSIKAFIRECRDAGMKVVATIVQMPGVDVEACRKVAEEELKVEFRVRTYNDLG